MLDSYTICAHKHRVVAYHQAAHSGSPNLRPSPIFSSQYFNWTNTHHLLLQRCLSREQEVDSFCVQNSQGWT